MLENMAGVVGATIQAERLAKASQNLRIAEARYGRRATTGGGYRQAVARAMQELVARIVPVAAGSGEYTRAVGR